MKKKKPKQTNPYARQMKENPLKAGAHKVKAKEADKYLARGPITEEEMDQSHYDIDGIITYLETVIEDRALTAKIADMLKKKDS